MGALHLATAISLNLNKPMLLPRLERKKHGLGKTIESDYSPGQKVCLIEDIVTTGGSLARVEEFLVKEGLIVVKKICFLSYFENSDVTSLTSLKQILQVLMTNSSISKDIGFSILKSFYDRKASVLNTYPSPLREVVEKKKSLLIVALDVPWNEAKKLIPLLAPYVVAFKFHYDILYQSGDYFNDYKSTFTPLKLMALAEQHNFLVIRDRKYGDVSKINEIIAGSPGKSQDINIVHLLPGEKSLPQGPIIVILDMSTQDNLFSSAYRDQVLQETINNPQVLGYVSQHKWWDENSEKLCFTPGINIKPRLESDTKQIYSNPASKRKDGSDLFIVGSAITKSEDPIQEARMYRDTLWELSAE